ncbi:protein KPLCE-like [Cinclus cinclus]|uniref:protein KPLCE-like n=1 Tax=Cinclus cinclus TaxID=127875 RepID=UPI002E13E1B8
MFLSRYPRAGSALGKVVLSEPASCQAVLIRVPSGPCHQDTRVSEPASCQAVLIRVPSGPCHQDTRVSEPASCQAVLIRVPSGPCHQDTRVSEPASCQAVLIRVPSGPCHQDTRVSEPASCQAVLIRVPSGPCHQDTRVSEPASLPGRALRHIPAHALVREALRGKRGWVRPRRSEWPRVNGDGAGGEEVPATPGESGCSAGAGGVRLCGEGQGARRLPVCAAVGTRGPSTACGMCCCAARRGAAAAPHPPGSPL